MDFFNSRTSTDIAPYWAVSSKLRLSPVDCSVILNWLMGGALPVHYSGGSNLPDEIAEWLKTNGSSFIRMNIACSRSRLEDGLKRRKITGVEYNPAGIHSDAGQDAELPAIPGRTGIMDRGAVMMSKESKSSNRKMRDFGGEKAALHRKG